MRARADHVGRSHLDDVEPAEQLADARCVVDRQRKVPLDPGELVPETHEVGANEHIMAIVGLATPIGRVEVERHVSAIVALDEGMKAPKSSYSITTPASRS